MSDTSTFVLEPRSARSRGRRILQGLLITVILGAPASYYSPWKLTYNITPSAPRGLYLEHRIDRMPMSELHYGERILFRYRCPRSRFRARVAPGRRALLRQQERTRVTRAIPGTGIDGTACLDRQVAPYPDGAHFIKEVAGKPGDRLYTRNGSDYIRRAGGKTIDVGAILARAPSGRPIPFHPTWNGQRIPRGQLYLSSTRVPQSYDSRYFGLVSRARILGTVKLLWRVRL